MNPRMHHARFAVFLCGCAAFLNLYATQSILPAFAESFQVSARQAGWSITVTTLAVAVTAPFVGRLTGRFEQRTVIAVAALLLALPTLLTALCGQFCRATGVAFCRRDVDSRGVRHQRGLYR